MNPHLPPSLAYASRSLPSSSDVHSSRFRDGSNASRYRFEQASSVRPGILRAITAHFVPCKAYSESSFWSSSAVHAVFLTLGESECSQRYCSYFVSVPDEDDVRVRTLRHALFVRPGTDRATVFQLSTSP